VAVAAASAGQVHSRIQQAMESTQTKSDQVPG